MSGPNDNFDQIYEEYNKKIVRYLSLKVDIQTAEDVSQLTFVKAMENWHTFRGDSSVSPMIKQGEIPTFLELETDSWDFEKMKGFQFSYLLCEFILQKYGLEVLNKIIRTPDDFKGVFSCSSLELHNQWKTNIKTQLNL
ncbi:RNA polymerase sigma factor [Paenibacillus sp. 32352]|uniref:RNA polymerase sigma factor n=1 Tax=Paenibacillus sp. 32352 TaxID=1969111 RepID=UPI0009AC3C22|nr:hypothetical protein [Paenibacillus sp. 32352]